MRKAGEDHQRAKIVPNHEDYFGQNRFVPNSQPVSFVLFRFSCRMDSIMAYLPGVEVNHDHEGGSSRMRLSHCTSGQLTPTMVSNVDHLNAQFLLVGDCVRAIPLKMNQAKQQSESEDVESIVTALINTRMF